MSLKEGVTFKFYTDLRVKNVLIFVINYQTPTLKSLKLILIMGVYN